MVLKCFVNIWCAAAKKFLLLTMCVNNMHWTATCTTCVVTVCASFSGLHIYTFCQERKMQHLFKMLTTVSLLIVYQQWAKCMLFVSSVINCLWTTYTQNKASVPFYYLLISARSHGHCSLLNSATACVEKAGGVLGPKCLLAKKISK